ncbi:MAG: ArnT family glycosyltransferase [Endomicrobiia bacterium]
MKEKYLILFIILIFAFIIRFSLINFGLPSKNLALTTYNPDEAITFYSIEKWQPKKFYFHPYDGFFWGGFHLYPVALSLGIAKILGYIKLENREFYINNLVEADKLYIVARMLMILFGTGSILILFFILKESYTEFTGLIGAGFLTILPLHIFNSIYVRPDIMMLFFGLLAIYFSVKMLKTGFTKYYILSCLSVGFSCGTKLNGGVFGILPVLAHFLADNKPEKEANLIKKKFLDYRLYLIPLICLAGFIISSPYVIIDFNSSQHSFLRYLKHNLNLAKGTMDLGQTVLFGSGVVSYYKYYLLYGVGTAIVLFSIFGMIVMFYNTIVEKNKVDILFLISGIVILSIISSTKNQAVWYTLPVIPFIIIFTSRGFGFFNNIISIFSKRKIIKILCFLTLFFVFGYTFIYAISYWKLYFYKNVREECSEWIKQNIPYGSEVAIARSYFWTPPVLRQYNPPYKVLMGADPVKSSVQDGVLGLEKLLDETEYVVLTEYEYRWAIHPKLKKYFSQHREIVKKIFNSGEFVKLAEFDREAKFLWFKFNKNYPPGDWLIPNPKIVVFKKNKNFLVIRN